MQYENDKQKQRLELYYKSCENKLKRDNGKTKAELRELMLCLDMDVKLVDDFATYILYALRTYDGMMPRSQESTIHMITNPQDFFATADEQKRFVEEFKRHIMDTIAIM